MLLSENKLRRVIRSIILKEMAMPIKGQPGAPLASAFGGVTAGQGNKTGAPNEEFYHAPFEKKGSYVRKPGDELHDTHYMKQLSWRLAAYPGCTIYAAIGLTDLDTAMYIQDHMNDDSAIAQAKPQFGDTGGLCRMVDITENAEAVMQQLSENFDMQNPDVKKYFDDVYSKIKMVNSNDAGAIFYLGSHNTNREFGDPPTAFNMLHQIYDGSYSNTNPYINEVNMVREDIYESIYEAYSDSDNDPDSPETFACFEGRGVKSSNSETEFALNLILMAVGWLNPDDGTIMKDNATNQGLAGSSDPYDIVRRCLDPAYKNDEELISRLVDANLHGNLINGVAAFWNTFKGRIILTYSGRG